MLPPLCCQTQSLSDVPLEDDWLSEGERNVLAGFRFPKRRNDWRLGRWTAKRAILNYRALSASDLARLEIRAAADGAPEVFFDGAPAGVAVSISHAGGRSFCVAGPLACALGCDLEQLEFREDSLVADYFAPEEMALCAQAAARDRVLAVNLIWSAKESMLKALREGLRRDTRTVRVRPDLVPSREPWRSWTGFCPDQGREFFGRWRADDAYVYTVASGAAGFEISNQF